MEKTAKLRPRTLDITFCERAIRAQFATCARNLDRYAIRKWPLVSVFAEPPCDFAASDCNYCLQDARKTEA